MTDTQNNNRHPSLAEQVKAMQHAMKLSDRQLAEALHLSEKNGADRIHKWKSGAQVPSGPAFAYLKLIYAVDNSLRVIDSGEWEQGHKMLRDALPDFLQ